MKKSVATRNPNLQQSLKGSKEPSAPVDAAGGVQEAWRKNERGDTSLIGPRQDYWWTGKRPSECPGVDAHGIVTSLAVPNLNTCTRKEVRDYFDNTWTLTDILFSGLQGEEAFYRHPYHQLRHPMIFYYGHTACVYVNKLRVAGLIKDPVNANYENIFETGVDEMSWDDISDENTEWPAVREVVEYRRTVYKIIIDLIENSDELDSGAPITMKTQMWGVFMGMEHERIHIETSSVLLRELPVHLLVHPKEFPTNHPSAEMPSQLPPTRGQAYPQNEFVAVEAEEVTLGKPLDWPSYGWDNEYGTRTVRVPNFDAQKFKVSNGEFWEFVKDGGYHQQKYWTSNGWEWRRFRNIKWPTFWVPVPPAGLHHYKLRCVYEIVDMPWSWPVVVNYHEATAYANWLKEKDGDMQEYRVLCEAEHFAIRDHARPVPALKDDHVMNHDGRQMAKKRVANVNLAFASESPVDAFPANGKGFHDVWGSLWEWMEDEADGLDNFTVHPYYDDYSVPCFDGEHNIIQGGSFISTGDEASIFSRYHFRPHFYQHAGFRVVRSSHPAPVHRLSTKKDKTGDMYEDKTILNEYLSLHFGANEQVCPLFPDVFPYTRFPQRCAELLLQQAERCGVHMGRALDLGCAVGGSSFELCRKFSEVVGIDLSQQFIHTAQDIAKSGVVEYDVAAQGARKATFTVHLDATVDRSRATFLVGDACALPTDIGDFDAVLTANLLCRTPNPRAVLDGLAKHIRKGGILVNMSPYTWREQFTPKTEWLGGTDERESSQDLREHLSPSFELVHEDNMPLLIREHERKFQFIVSHASVWKKK